MRPKSIRVPDQVWRTSGLDDGAKLLWCFLVANADRKESTYSELREQVGTCQTSLLKYLDDLANHGLTRSTKRGVRTVALEVAELAASPAITVPTELLFDPQYFRAAKWVWGVIRRHNGPFGFTLLQELTGYAQESLSKYLNQLRAGGWLVGSSHRVGHKAEFALQAINPCEVRRQAELEEFARGMEVARRQEGYSQGQYLLARMVRLLLPDSTIVENAEVTGLDNIETGGRMHYDLLLPVERIAIEFNGPQHDMPTERFSSPEAFQAQRHRDILKRGLSQEQGITLLVVRANDLDFNTIRGLLAAHVAVREDVGDQWHLRDEIERAASLYRKKAALARRPS